MVDLRSLFPLHLLNMVSAGCLSKSLAGGRSSLFTSKQRSTKSLRPGGMLSGIGGDSTVEAI